MQRLGGMDASFLYGETATYPTHVVGILIFDPSDRPDGFTFDHFKGIVGSRLHLMPMLRQRVLEVPFNLDNPVAIDDPDFNLENHLHHAAVPSPGTRRDLADLVGEIASHRLDRRRPLWEMWLLEGLDDGSLALCTKIHHAMIDGATGADLMPHLLDLKPGNVEAPPPEHPWVPDRVPSELDLARAAVIDRVRDPLRGVHRLARTGRTLVDMGLGMMGIGTEEKLNPAAPFTSPRTVLNDPISSRRLVAIAQAPLDDFKYVKNVFGTTVNDVVLAATSLALRAYLLAHDDLPERSLVVSVPVSVHGDAAAGTNQVSNMFVRLPVDLEDPVEQLMTIRVDTREAKAVHNAMGANLIADMSQMVPPGIYNLGMRLMSDSRVAGLLPPVQSAVVSNVPGPPIPMYFGGARVTGVFPFGPLIEGSGINITVLSNMGNMDIGVIACRDTTPDVWDIGQGIVDAVAALRKAAEERSGTTGPTRSATDSEPAQN